MIWIAVIIALILAVTLGSPSHEDQHESAYSTLNRLEEEAGNATRSSTIKAKLDQMEQIAAAHPTEYSKCVVGLVRDDYIDRKKDEASDAADKLYQRIDSALYEFYNDDFDSIVHTTARKNRILRLYKEYSAHIVTNGIRDEFDDPFYYDTNDKEWCLAVQAAAKTTGTSLLEYHVIKIAEDNRVLKNKIAKTKKLILAELGDTQHRMCDLRKKICPDDPKLFDYCCQKLAASSRIAIIGNGKGPYKLEAIIPEED